MKVGVFGSSGYAGVELLRLLDAHPTFDLQIAAAGSHAGMTVSALTPSLHSAYGGLIHAEADPTAFAGLDVVFLALPHGEAERLVPRLMGSVGKIVDLSADFRLRDVKDYEQWYDRTHGAPELLERFVYAIPELHRDRIAGADLIAVAGCYPTATTLALWPFARAGLLPERGVIVDAVSGTSGAGRAASDRLQFAHVEEDFSAYGLFTHRHTPEMEQNLGVEILFTPHLAPMSRGILATCYVPSSVLDSAGALELLHQAYDTEPFIEVLDTLPSTKATRGSNSAHLYAHVDPRTKHLVVLSAIDNLVKGAAGQAIQCANLMTTQAEATGLPRVGIYP